MATPVLLGVGRASLHHRYRPDSSEPFGTRWQAVCRRWSSRGRCLRRSGVLAGPSNLLGFGRDCLVNAQHRRHAGKFCCIRQARYRFGLGEPIAGCAGFDHPAVSFSEERGMRLLSPYTEGPVGPPSARHHVRSDDVTLACSTDVKLESRTRRGRSATYGQDKRCRGALLQALRRQRPGRRLRVLRARMHRSRIVWAARQLRTPRRGPCVEEGHGGLHMDQEQASCTSAGWSALVQSGCYPATSAARSSKAAVHPASAWSRPAG